MAASAPPIPTLVEGSTEVLYYLGLSVAVGFGLAVAALVIPQSSGGVLAGRLSRLARPAAMFVAITAVLHFLAAAATSAKTGLPNALTSKVLVAFIESPARDGGFGPGKIALIQLGGYALAVVALIVLSVRGSRVAGSAVAVCAVATAVFPDIPLTNIIPSRVATALLTIGHVLGALVWIGGLVVLAVVGLVGRRRDSGLDADDGRAGVLAEEWRHAWERFSVAALLAVGTLIVSGSWLAWSHVGTPAQLLTTAYGRYLAIKLVLVVVLLAAGAYNVRVLIPRIRAARRQGDTGTAFRVAAQHFPTVVGGECVLATAVLVVVPFLRGSARSEAGWPNAGPFDLEVFGVGLLLVALVAGSLWVGTHSTRNRRAASAER